VETLQKNFHDAAANDNLQGGSD